MRRARKRLVSDVASRKNKELEFQSSGCQPPPPRERARERCLSRPNLTGEPMPPELRDTHTRARACVWTIVTAERELDLFLQPVVDRTSNSEIFFTRRDPLGGLED